MKIIQVVGYKNAGKTTLVCEVVRELASEGMRIGTLKHDAHDLDPEQPGKDTWKHREAGAIITAITSPSRTAWVEELPTPLGNLVASMKQRSLDILIIEGFKTADYSKILLLRGEEDAELLGLARPVAVILREPNVNLESQAAALSLPVFIHSDLNSFGAFLDFLRLEFTLGPKPPLAQ